MEKENSTSFSVWDTIFDTVSKIQEKTQKQIEVIDKITQKTVSVAKPVIHYGFIPFVIYLGSKSNPPPNWFSLFPSENN
ncbi:import receptor subunit tom7 [Anaeramoeba ignava]|uniref:Import receptor subunit tom7 n=1 Tax=Anaeramoeba ignava TaxID=1746090 RepID=A0A9Q0RDD0_ANAIG|nr:import receptor subunit tom7 [Anaeramoeba ignava]